MGMVAAFIRPFFGGANAPRNAERHDFTQFRG